MPSRGWATLLRLNLDEKSKRLITTLTKTHGINAERQSQRRDIPEETMQARYGALWDTMEFSWIWLILSIETLVLVCGQKGKIAPTTSTLIRCEVILMFKI